MNTQRFAPACQAGISMVEMMVAVTLGLFVLVGIGLTLTSTSHSRTELDRALQQIENSRYAMQMLAHDLRHAGYYGRYVSELPVPAAMPDPCAASLAALETGMALPVQGYDAPATVPPELAPCLASANWVPGTDILVVRRAQASEPIDLPAASPGQVYLQTTAYPSGPRYLLGTGSNPAAFTLIEKRDDHSGATVPAGLLPYRVHVYFVSPCDIPTTGDTCSGTDDDGGRPISTLKRLELAADVGGNPVMRTVPLVEGIQDLQIDYGIDQPAPGASVGDGAPDTYTAAPATPSDWGNVVAVQLNLLAANTEPTPGHADGKRYNLGLAGTVGPFGDAYKRHALSAVVRVNNVSGPREQ
jgi:type IV pilus assembly protein PilW